MSVLTAVHGQWVHSRRVRVLAERIAPLLSPGWVVADVGAGDGMLAAALCRQMPALLVQGYDVLVRPRTAVPVTWFDGQHLPLDDRSVDAVLLVDVLHHAEQPLELLREAARVARAAVIVKDHRTSRPLAHATLRFMDYVGNKGHGVAIPCNYWSMPRWQTAWQDVGLVVELWETELGLYPWPANWLFETGLHFLARLRRREER